MTVKEVFDLISEEPGTNNKMAILKQHKDTHLLKEVLYLANSRRVKFYIKQIPAYTTSVESLTLAEALEELKLLSSRQRTGHEGVQLLWDTLTCLSKEDAYIIERIIEKDCKIGMGTTNINKIFPGLIEDTPYMGAKPFSKDLVTKLFGKAGRSPVLSQMKMDGTYRNIIIADNTVEVESRQGEPSHLDGATFLNELSKFPNGVMNGELTMIGSDGKTLARFFSNGVISSLNSIIGKRKNGENVEKEIGEFLEDKGMTIEQALNSICFTSWDMITLSEYVATKSQTPYFTRLENVASAISQSNPTRVKLIEQELVFTYEEAMNHFQRTLALGHEGTILKAYDGPWKDGKPVHQIKLKLEIHIDLEIIGFQYGTKGTKNENVISTILAKSSDGLLYTDPSGMTEKMMQWVTDNQKSLMGKILEVKCSGISQNSKGEYSTYHPCFSEIRDDKTVADSLATILKIEAGAKGLA